MAAAVSSGRITNGPSSLDLFVNHGLEVNVERDLDPAVDSMNTNGPIALNCSIERLRQSTIVERSERASEWTVAAGAARSVSLYESTAGTIVRSA